MTKTWSEARLTAMATRNAAICAYYASGRTVTECCERFHLRKGRVWQVLKAGGVYRPRVKGERSRFLGVTVTPETKDALVSKAAAQGVSVSQLTADALDALVEKP